jgi:hypothetical protein
MRRFPRTLLIALSASLLLTSCSDSGNDEDPLALIASCVSTLAGAGARVYADCATSSGAMVSVDVFAANVADEVDAYNIVVNFSPSVFRYMGFAPSETLFEPTACSNGSSLCLDNLATNANTSGQVVYGVTRIGVNPMNGVVPGTGPARLGRLTFEAVSDSQTAIAFQMSASAGCVGQSTTGNALMTVSSSTGCLVTIIPGISFGQGSVTLSAVLQ